jgi:hypothetical protein
MLCRRRTGEQAGFVCLGPAKENSQWSLYRREADLLLADTEKRLRCSDPSPNGNHSPPLDWQARAKSFADALTPQLANELAGILGLPVVVLSELKLLGFCAKGPFGSSCWTFPEVNGAGNVIGITCRHRDGSKKAWPDGKRGLSLPARWQEREGPILLPEGASDTLASTALGFSAIGRPSNMGGVEHLAELLHGFPADRQIIVLGEFDVNDKGQWPGRDGAVKTADELSARLGRSVQWALPPDRAKDARAWSHGRNLPTEGEAIGDDWDVAGQEFLSKLKLINAKTPEANRAPGFQWVPIDSAAFANSDFRPTWLCKKVLVDKQVAVIGGPQKSLKTSLALDLAISLASATQWLGEFACPAVKRVAVLSGESGPGALQSIARRVCLAKNIDLAELGGNLYWQFTLPQLAVREQLDALRAGLEKEHVEVVVVDPLYLCLLSGVNGPKAENLFDTGPLLLQVAQTCLLAGATPALLHHTTKPSGRKVEPLELADLAFSGIAEFARQWILVSRREGYDPDTGLNRLWLSAGGSVGHGGLWAVDIDEGLLAEDFTGRKWAVTVQTSGEARQVERNQREEAKRQKQIRCEHEDDGAVLAALDRIEGRGKPTSVNAVTTETGLPRERAKRSIARLIEEELVEPMNVQVATGQGLKGRREAAGLRRKPSV